MDMKNQRLVVNLLRLVHFRHLSCAPHVRKCCLALLVAKNRASNRGPTHVLASTSNFWPHSTWPQWVIIYCSWLWKNWLFIWHRKRKSRKASGSLILSDEGLSTLSFWEQSTSRRLPKRFAREQLDKFVFLANPNSPFNQVRIPTQGEIGRKWI